MGYYFISPVECKHLLRSVTVLDCKLIQRTSFQEIYSRLDIFGITYQIYTPSYLGINGYPDNTYCIWNVADKGFVTYRIIDLQLQEPGDCNGTGCNCPDSVAITMGTKEIRLCGSATISSLNGHSFDGLQVKFCSDNMLSSKGVLMMAYVNQPYSLCKLTEYSCIYWTEQELMDFNFKIGQEKTCGM